MKRILVLDQDYPSAENLYGNVFVHTRVKEYQKHAIVQVVSFFSGKEDYTYEGIHVLHAVTSEDLKSICITFKPDAIFIHFYHRNLYSFIAGVEIPVVIWVHGYEALGWYRRLFNYTFFQTLRHLHHIVIPNVKQMVGFRKLIGLSNKINRIHFVFVSNWMRKVAEQDAAIKIKRFSIIANPINVGLFKYRPKEKSDRFKVLLIRSFGSKKYANDIAIDAILKLSESESFEKFTFCIYGSGKYFKPLTSRLSRFANVTLHETFLDNSMIPDVHRNYGIFLCPTRQDAQGVSMCEAMASGLVPLTSDCTAIPEFVDHRETGLLSNNSDELASCMEEVVGNADLFLRISQQASAFINERLSLEKIISEEMSLLNLYSN